MARTSWHALGWKAGAGFAPLVGAAPALPNLSGLGRCALKRQAGRCIWPMQVLSCGFSGSICCIQINVVSKSNLPFPSRVLSCCVLLERGRSLTWQAGNRPTNSSSLLCTIDTAGMHTHHAVCIARSRILKSSTARRPGVHSSRLPCHCTRRYTR